MLFRSQQDEGSRHPFEVFNDEFAFVLSGGTHHILWETTDSHGHPVVQHLAETSFHKMHASRKWMSGRKEIPFTLAWMEAQERRSYKGVCFQPGQSSPNGWYNLWRGFAVQPADTSAHPSVEAFKEHALKNVCGGDKHLYHWLMCYFAHMIQHPEEKPLCALVFKGGKGVGKNALIERVGHLLGNHFMLTSKRRYLTSNFNAHFEANLMFVLDEAFWSGDKEAEGVLKDLVTGSKHVIEHKGAGVFEVDNKTRVVIIGNEEWLVPATADERRWAVFDVGEGRKQDRKFFEDMRVGMEQGGYAHLLRFLLDYNITADVNAAPHTQALADQKIESLNA